MNTLEQLIHKTSSGELIDIFQELESGVVPKDGCSHRFCNKVNHLIDKGQMCINPTSYRKVYLPTLSKVIQKELARRFVDNLLNGVL